MRLVIVLDAVVGDLERVVGSILCGRDILVCLKELTAIDCVGRSGGNHPGIDVVKADRARSSADQCYVVGRRAAVRGRRRARVTVLDWARSADADVIDL